MNSRQKKILGIVVKQGFITNNELSAACGVTPETIRKDLNHLESMNLLIRTHGGAKVSNDYYCTNFDARLQERYSAKKRIASLAATFVENNDILFIDAGTTTYLMHDQIKQNINFHVITNSQYNINEYSNNPNCKVISVGGFYDAVSNAYSGEVAQRALSYFNISKCFLSAAAISPSIGIMDTYPEQSLLSRIAKEKSAKTYVLADSSKFNKIALINLCPLLSGDNLITDSDLDEETARVLREMGVNVFFA